MAGEIQLNGTTALTESSGGITLNNVNSAANRTNLGLGTAATSASTDFVGPTRTITAGTGLSGGGDLSANRTIDVSFSANESNVKTALNASTGAPIHAIRAYIVIKSVNDSSTTGMSVIAQAGISSVTKQASGNFRGFSVVFSTNFSSANYAACTSGYHHHGGVCEGPVGIITNTAGSISGAFPSTSTIFHIYQPNSNPTNAYYSVCYVGD